MGYKEWYEANKEALSERRKERYHNDERYRDQVLQQNKSYRAKTKNQPVTEAQLEARRAKGRERYWRDPEASRAARREYYHGLPKDDQFHARLRKYSRTEYWKDPNKSRERQRKQYEHRKYGAAYKRFLLDPKEFRAAAMEWLKAHPEKITDEQWGLIRHAAGTRKKGK